MHSPGTTHLTPLLGLTYGGLDEAPVNRPWGWPVFPYMGGNQDDGGVSRPNRTAFANLRKGWPDAPCQRPGIGPR